MKRDWHNFTGEMPRISDELLPETAAETARNCKLWTGEITPLKGLKQTWIPTKVGTIKTIYLFGNQYWFHSANDVDFVRGAIEGDTTERTYFTGEGVPRITDNTIATQGGGTDYPIAYYSLGCPAPTSPPVATPGAGTCAAGDEETILYTYAYVDDFNQQGVPSLPSAQVIRCPGVPVTVSGMGTAAPAGAYNFSVNSKKRIYRFQQNQAGGDWQFVAEIPITQSSYVDTVANEDLGGILTTSYYDIPPTDLAGLTMGAYGVMAGFLKNQACFSEPWLFFAWPEGYRLPTSHPIVAISAIADSWIVLTTERPYLISGQHPGSFSQRRLESEQACVSKRSVVNFGDVLTYASPDGVVIVDAAGNTSICTAGLFTKDEWTALKPDSIMAVKWEKYYLGFYSTGAATGCFFFDPKNPEFVVFGDTYATARFNNLLTDSVFLQVGSNLVEWDADTTMLSYTYRPRAVTAVTPTRFAAARVYAASYPVTFKLYVDGALKLTQSVTSAVPFRLPSGFKGRKWAPEVTGTANIKQISIASTMGELRG